MILMNQENERLFLIDGSSIVFRSYHALPNLRTRGGIPTGAVYGFVNMLQEIMNQYQPKHLFVAFDRPEPTFRHEAYTNYKAKRPEPPEDLILQLPLIKEVLGAWGVPQGECSGLEADDLIGTLSKDAEAQGYEVIIVAEDKDLLQLVSTHVKVLKTQFKNSRLYGEKEVLERYRCQPNQLPDLFGLMGDAVDGIPGVPGIGEKTAITLIEQYGNLENLYNHLEELKAKRQRELLEQYRELAFLSRDLAKIRTVSDWRLPLEQTRLQEPDWSKLRSLFSNLEFRTLLNKLPQADKKLLSRKEYRIIDSSESLKELCETIRHNNIPFAIDTETTGLDPMRDSLVGISIALSPGEAFYLPLNHLDAQNLSIQDIKKHLGPILANPEIGKWGHHLKFDSAFLIQAGMGFEGIEFDTLLASQLVEPEQSAHNLEQLVLAHLGVQMVSIEELIGSGKQQKSMKEVPLKQASEYACEDADATYQLVEVYRKLVHEQGLEELYYEIELPLVPVLRDMEMTGVLVDEQELSEQSEQLGLQIEQLERQIHKLAGVRFNVNSSKQLAEVLYDRLGLEAGRKRSTAVDVLEKLASEGVEIASAMIEYRQLAKLKSTYLDAFPAMIHPKTGRIHTSYHQTGAGTGRISSSEPNLQNIPIRTEIGKRIRRAFKASEGCLLMSADYSQIELRILAHLSGDPGLIRAFEADEDIHSFTAREIFGLDPDQPVSAEARRRAKEINFGLNYGMTPYGLAQRLGIEPQEARDYMERYFNRYPKVLEYVERTKKTARELGFVITLKGRRIPTPAVHSSSNLQREAADRAAINAPIQGSAADLLKMAMVKMGLEIAQRNLISRMILTVHDEIIFETPENELEVMKGLIREVMEGVIRLHVPLKVDLKWGANWAEL